MQRKNREYANVIKYIWATLLFLSDEHTPVHVHIENSDGKAKINLLPIVEVVENKNIKIKDIKKALKIVKLYKDEFIKAWNEYHEN